ncbi:chorismate synthase [Acetivibrio ethanolgignens]|uniref:Chorismate synthase n=1 Tax=Acetivibrio ethanolgignens TaxID=290052 RepID=A0A0V8QE09_9FIRM|nr:chorismate synthase [Acetivibrio ethanolgignens]KSV58297.1 chorismate synthase [Acetivibrio ethanolgignens]
MSGSTYGNIFKITTWGESHGKGLGVVVDGCPAGLPLDETFIQGYLNRRRPGGIKYSTPRKESDTVSILSGVLEGRTTGTPISMAVMNESQRSSDYSEIASYYRPGHADYTLDAKYGFRDYRGGGRSSGRETIGRVAGGAVALALLKELGIHITAYAKAIGPVTFNEALFTNSQGHRFAPSWEQIAKSPLYLPDAEASRQAEDYLKEQMAKGDSAGGIIECIISGVPAGIGEPVFDKLDACLAKSILSIGAVKGFEIGSGFACASMEGSRHNDSFQAKEDGSVIKKTNHSGGILGGISDGSDIIFRAAIKPTPSISLLQDTINQSHENLQVSIKGRHDPIIVPRAVVVVEAMAAVALADLLLENMASRMDFVKKFYTLF